MVNLEQTTVFNPPNLPGWEKVNAAVEITKRTNLPCKIENDANVSALGCLHFGKGKKLGSFVMLTLGTGVGGAIVYNNKLFKKCSLNTDPKKVAKSLKNKLWNAGRSARGETSRLHSTSASPSKSLFFLLHACI